MQQTFEVNIVLVGVSGVGKTTLGRLASKNLGIGFVDLDDSFGREERSDIDSLMTKYGDNGYAKRILAHYAKLVNENKGIIIAASPQLFGSQEFWQITKKNATSIHLRGKPLQ